MNKERILAAAEWMKKIHQQGENFSLLFWQDRPQNQAYDWPQGESARPVTTAEQAFACGMTCCFGGWLALSPEFQAAGGFATYVGAPVFNGLSGARGIADYFQIDDATASKMISPNLAMEFYGFRAIHVNAIDVAERLLKFVEKGE